LTRVLATSIDTFFEAFELADLPTASTVVGSAKLLFGRDRISKKNILLSCRQVSEDERKHKVKRKVQK
jgi:hypothetical protein